MIRTIKTNVNSIVIVGYGALHSLINENINFFDINHRRGKGGRGQGGLRHQQI